MDNSESEALRGFLSHTSSDKEFVRRLAKDLQSQGIQVWLDEWVIKGGESLSDKIQKGIETSDVFILVLSKKALESEWVKEELRAAYHMRFDKSQEFAIIPVIIEEEVTESNISLFLKDYYYISFRSEDSYEKSLGKLCDSIIFRGEFIEKYKKVYEGGFILNDITVHAKISGYRQENAYFEEDYRILSTKKIDRIRKSFEHDGELVSAELTTGSLKRERIRKSTEQWILQHEREMMPQKEATFKLKYLLKDEFRIAKNWYYTIDAPTRNFTFVFLFASECTPDTVKVNCMQTQTKLSEEVLQPSSVEAGTRYEFKRAFPGYKDWFQFEWE